MSRISVRILVVATALALVAVAPAAAGASPGERAAPAAAWTKQAPLPTWYDLEGVDMVSATEGWAVGAQGTILHTTDGGATWSPQSSGTTEPLNAVRFLDAQHGWAVGNVMLWTGDGGLTWNKGNAFPASNYGVDFADLTHGWAVGSGGVVYRTVDGGRNWSGSPTPTAQNLKDVDFVSAARGWAVGGDGAIIRTTNGGASWSVQPSGTTAFLDGVSFVSAQEGWAAGGSTILHTTNGGASWLPQPTPPGAWAYSLAFTDALHGWAAGESLVATTDGGQTWQLQSIDNVNRMRGVDVPDASNGVIVGEKGGAFSTEDGGATWTTRLNGAPTEVYGMDANDSLHAWAVGTFGETQYTVDGGTTWTRVPAGNPFGHHYAVDFLPNNSRGWLVGDGDQSNNHGVIYRSDDGGKTWTLQFSGGFLTQLYGVAAINATTAVAVGNLGLIWRTTNGGQSWTQVPHPNISAVLSDVEFHGQVGTAVGNGSAVLRSRDGGATWFNASPTLPFPASLSGGSFADPRNGWAVGFDRVVMHTTDGGRTWTRQPVPGSQGVNFLAVVAVSPTVAWISGGPTTGFVARTTDGGQTWTREILPGDPLSISSLAFPTGADEGWAAGYIGIWHRAA
jgi:photosystem II stability/assembly factor-like uncharacterized protein